MTVRAEPKTYRQRVPPGIGSSSASRSRARKPVRSWSQSANGLSKGNFLLGLGPEPLELHQHFRIAPWAEPDLESIHRAGGNLVPGMALEVECAGVTGTQEPLAASVQVDGAAEVRALRGQREHRLGTLRGLADQPHRPDRFLGVLDPGILPILEDRERTRETDGQLAEAGEGHEATVSISPPQGGGQ